MRSILLICLAGVLAGCRSHGGPRAFVVSSSLYGEAFDATRDELRRAGYTLERVDAANGELLTAPKTVAGFATPFAPEPGSIGQMTDDTLNSQPRTVRVTFRDAAGGPPGVGDVTETVEVVIWRTNRPGTRLETEAIRASSVWIDPALAERGVRNGMLVPLRRDDNFAGELAGRVRDRLSAEREE
ncbi:MAG: hypothetical protein H6810_03685 [Phycisphaeraceae bacterium]|nr:MAG: hypothetical protein H6810_03685 [Phycisphaeraceae bacterium]